MPAGCCVVGIVVMGRPCPLIKELLLIDEYGNRGHKFPGLFPKGSVGSQGLHSPAAPMKMRLKK